MKLEFLAVAILTTACGREVYIDAELCPYVEEYERICGSIENTTTIKFSDISGTSVARCSEIEKFALPTEWFIYIEREFWDKSSEYQRKFLVFHELLHCEKGYNDLKSQESQDDWMYGYTASEAVIRESWEKNKQKYCGVTKFP